MATLEIVIICILAISLAVNICYGPFNRQMGRYTGRWDLFRWISAYQLFAETPRSFRLIYREKRRNGEKTVWQEIPLRIPRKWYHLIFFPENLVPDNIYSFVDDLVRWQESAIDRQIISESFKYRTVLNFVGRVPASEDSAARQFKIEETEGLISNKAREVFVSEFHKNEFFDRNKSGDRVDGPTGVGLSSDGHS